MALKIVRATSDASETRPLRLWLQGREADALARLADPAGGELADDAGQLVALAIQAGERHAATIGAALARWDDDVAAYRILQDHLRVADRRDRRRRRRPLGARAAWR